MSPSTCFYVNCPNSNETHFMFRFPFYNEERLKKWIINSGNSYLSHLKAEKWRCRFLCSSHFDESKYEIQGEGRARILAPAVPMHYNGEEETIDIVNEAPSTDSKLLPCKEGREENAIKSPYNSEDEALDDNIGIKQSSTAETVLKPRLKEELYKPSTKKRKLANNCMDVERIKRRKLVKRSRKAIQDKNARKRELDHLDECSRKAIQNKNARKRELDHLDECSRKAIQNKNARKRELDHLDECSRKAIQNKNARKRELDHLDECSRKAIQNKNARKRELDHLDECSRKAIQNKNARKRELDHLDECSRKAIQNKNARKRELDHLDECSRKAIQNKNARKRELDHLDECSRKAIQNKNARKRELEHLDEHKFPSKNAKILTYMQLRRSHRNWWEAEKSFSISLYNFDPDCYRFLLDNGIVLPPEATIKNWLFKMSVVNSSPGLAKEECVASVSVKVESAEECGASIEERHEEISGASVKEEPEDYGANVKQEDCGSAASVCEEHELTLELGPEQLQPQDIAFTLSARRTKDNSVKESETARVDSGCVPTEAEKNGVVTRRVAVARSQCSNHKYSNRSASM